MPWKEVSTMSAREEFVMLASQEGANVRELCRRFEISAPTGYKWLTRYRAGGSAALQESSRRPQYSPARTSAEIERMILQLRDQHPEWGARKLRRRLRDLGHAMLPAPSCIHAILVRNQRIDLTQSSKHQAFTRFEHAAANEFWQMDFKGHVALREGRCHPLTVLDDHSRFNLCLQACANERGATVQNALTEVFHRYGLPQRIGVDNGAPWGDTAQHPYTPLTVWLMRLGIRVTHSRAYHPQTLGKDERFHRTLNVELLRRTELPDLSTAQRCFDAWRQVYNFERPHESLAMATPASRYRMSTRSFPLTLPAIDYAADCQIRRVDQNGKISFKGTVWRVGEAFCGYRLGLRPTMQESIWDVYFGHQKIKRIDLSNLDR
jgi:transposase InsO family protein